MSTTTDAVKYFTTGTSNTTKMQSTLDDSTVWHNSSGLGATRKVVERCRPQEPEISASLTGASTAYFHTCSNVVTPFFAPAFQFRQGHVVCMKYLGFDTRDEGMCFGDWLRTYNFKLQVPVPRRVRGRTCDMTCVSVIFATCFINEYFEQLVLSFFRTVDWKTFGLNSVLVWLIILVGSQFFSSWDTDMELMFGQTMPLMSSFNVSASPEQCGTTWSQTFEG